MCPLVGCGFPVKREQARLFQRMFLGEGRAPGPSVDLEDEIDRLDSEVEEDHWHRHPTSGIVIPDWAKR